MLSWNYIVKIRKIVLVLAILGISTFAYSMDLPVAAITYVSAGLLYDVNSKNNYGWTALHWATNGKHIEIVKLLVARGADIFAKDDRGQTPLHIACGSTNAEEVASVLIKYAVFGALNLNKRPLVKKLILMCNNNYLVVANKIADKLGNKKDLQALIES